jgi:hypothetical protein
MSIYGETHLSITFIINYIDVIKAFLRYKIQIIITHQGIPTQNNLNTDFDNNTIFKNPSC